LRDGFTGRDVLLDRLADLLASDHLVVLTGPPGIGKTELALAHATRRRADYDVVWWVRAERAETLAGDLSALGRRLGSGAGGRQPEELVAVGEWLGSHDRWLLVLDDAESMGTLRALLPDAGRGHVLVTTRAATAGITERTLRVGALSPEAGGELLARHSSKGEGDARRVAEALGGLPIALELAGAYVSDHGSLGSYRKRLLSRGSDLLSDRDRPDPRNLLAAALRVTLERLVSATPAAVQVLRFCSFLAPDRIPVGLVRAWAETLPKPSRRAMGGDRLDELLSQLARRALVERGEGTLSVHRQVQLLVREDMSHDERGALAGEVAAVLAEAFPLASNEDRSAPACRALLAHALAAADHAEAGAAAALPGHEAVGRLLNQVGGYLQARGDLPGARTCFQRALAADRAVHGKGHPTVAVRLNNLGTVLREMGRLDDARAALELALAVDEAAYGPDHPEVATDCNNLGLVLRELGDLEGARANFERALYISEIDSRPDQPAVVTTLRNLTSVLEAQGEGPAAGAVLERAAAVAEEAFGPDQPEVATDLFNAGRLRREHGDLPAARTTLERALAIDEATHGPGHPEVAADLNHLGAVKEDMGDLAGARADYTRALAIAEAHFGPRHATVVTCLNNLGNVRRAAADVAGAVSDFERAAELAEVVYGPGHTTLAVCLNNLGLARKDLGDRRGARIALERALRIDEAALGPEDPTVAVRLNNLGNLLRDQRKLTAARAVLQRAAELAEASLGADHPTTQTCRRNLALVEDADRRRAQARVERRRRAAAGP